MSSRVKCRGPVVLDTGFLISLASRVRPDHDTAKRYFAFWVESRTPMFLPSICLAEYLVRADAVPPNILRYVSVKSFTVEDASCAGRLLREGVLSRAEDQKTGRPIFKDDVKIIGSALSLRAAAIATADEKTMCKYVNAVAGNVREARGLIAISTRSAFNRGLAELASPDLGLE